MDPTPYNAAEAPQPPRAPGMPPAVVFPPRGGMPQPPVIGAPPRFVAAGAAPVRPPVAAPPMAAPPLAPPAAPLIAAPRMAPPVAAPPMAAPPVVGARPAAPAMVAPPAAPRPAPPIAAVTPSKIAPLPPAPVSAGRVISSLPPIASSHAAVPPPAPSQEGNLSGRAPGVSKVPSMPALFDNESQRPSDELQATLDVKNWPEIIIEPLHVLDSLCVKWGLDKLSAPVRMPQEPEYEPAPADTADARQDSSRAQTPPAPLTSIPSSSRLSGGYLRLLGLLYNGSPWEYSIPMSDLAQPGGVTIGRDRESSHIVLPESSISRCHLRLELTDAGVVVTDMRTTNGTFLDGRQLDPYEQQVPIKDGSILTLGDITLRVEILPPAVPAYSM